MSFETDDSYMDSDFDDNETLVSEDGHMSDESNISIPLDMKIQRFKVITSDDVVTQMNAEIKDVSDMLHVSFHCSNANPTKI